MALATQNMAKLENQQVTRTFGNQFEICIFGMSVDQQQFELVPLYIPIKLDSVLLILHCYTKLLYFISGPTYALQCQVSALEHALAMKRPYFMNRSAFMSSHIFSILWEITIYAHSFFTSTSTVEDSESTIQEQLGLLYTMASLDIKNFTSLTTTPLSDLPFFLLAL